MPKVRSLALLLLAVAACGESTTGPNVANVVVSPSSSTIDFLGSTQQFIARAEDASGNVLAGVTLTWTSSNPAVATVDQSGRATGLSAGTAQISASAEGITGQASLEVDPAPCNTDVSLNPGEWQVLPVDCAITLPSGSFGDRYRVAVVNQNLVESETLITDVAVRVARIDALAAPVAPSVVAAGAVQSTDLATRSRLDLTPRQLKHLRWAEGLRRRTQAAHRGLRAAEAALFESLGPGASLVNQGVQGAALTEPARQAVTLPDKLQLRANEGSTCEATVPLATALLLAQNDDMAIYQDSTQNAMAGREITVGQAQRILDYYSAYGKATVEQYFPGIPDIDSNGKIILYVMFDDPIDDGAIAAYVWGGDLFPAFGIPCAASNDRELVYFNSALVRALDDGFEQALETAVHEAKHISSFRHGIARSDWWGGDPFQPDWIEEGTAEIAGNISSRRAWATLGGPTAAARIGETELLDHYTANGNEFLPEVLGVIIRLKRAQDYLASQPNGLIVTPNGARSGSSWYGSGWTFMRWLGDVYGDAATAPYADASFFRAMNDSLTAPGSQGIEATTGKTIQALMEEFAAGVMLHMTPSEGADVAYTSYDFLTAIEIFCFSADDASGPCSGTGPSAIWPWPVTASSKDVLHAPFQDGEFTGSTGPTGIRIHDFRSDGTALGLAVRVTASQPAKVVIARTH